MVLIDVEHLAAHRGGHLADLGRVRRGHDLEAVGGDGDLHVRAWDSLWVEDHPAREGPCANDVAVSREPEEPRLARLDLESAPREQAKHHGIRTPEAGDARHCG